MLLSAYPRRALVLVQLEDVLKLTWLVCIASATRVIVLSIVLKKHTQTINIQKQSIVTNVWDDLERRFHERRFHSHYINSAS